MEIRDIILKTAAAVADTNKFLQSSTFSPEVEAHLPRDPRQQRINIGPHESSKAATSAVGRPHPT